MRYPLDFLPIGFGTLGHETKVVRFWVHRRADLTACKDKRTTYKVTYSFIPLHVTRVRYGSEFLSQIALDAPSFPTTYPD